MERKDMLLAVINHFCGGNKAKFAQKLGVTPQALNSCFKRNSYDAALIYAKCEGISPAWLLSGEGPMLEKERIGEKCISTKDTSKKEQKSDPKPEVEARLATRPGEGIPLLPLSAMAGALTSEATVLDYECERYVVPAFKGADFLIPVKGSSMYPKYSSGDIVACKRVPMSGLFFQWNKVYVIDTTQGPLIKRIKPGSNNDTVLIVSDNEKYDPFELPVSEIHAVALVIGVIRLE